VLSPRQAACVEAIAQGCSVAQIGEMLAMTPAAVRAQLDQARRRLGVAKRVRALAARSRGDGLA
jgi:DNA-binding CsgD family transcriptional regulator